MWRPAMSIKSKRRSRVSDGAGPSQSKRGRRVSGTDDEEAKPPTKGKMKNSKRSSDHPMSKIYNSSFRSHKPAELFRKDLISAMKLADSDQLVPEDYWLMADQWKEEWERGVQVPVNPETLPEANIRFSSVLRPEISEDFKLPKKYLHNAQDESFSSELHIVSAASLVADKACRYDLDDLDTSWLRLLNEERDNLGLFPIEEVTMELVIEELEAQCFDRLQQAIKSQEGLGIEFDEDVICDVCRSPDSEDGNEMVFCDSCNICVHQACYGITSIPEGSWICRTCALGIRPSCVLCPNKGGAMKSTKGGCEWAHVSCALWVPEVSIGCVEKMEPITKISQIPPSRWSLLCTLCKEKVGTCIQCSVKTCKTAYHVTCAFKHGLEMKAIIDEDNEDDGVKLRSYCEKHGKKAKTYSSESEEEPSKVKGVDRSWKELEMSTDDKAGAREKRIQEVRSEFYNYVSPTQVSESLSVDPMVSEFIFQYWKLKRRSNFDRPLLTPKAEESDALSRQQEDSLYARMKMFVHLRQDLERVRNLCYMVSRREKISRSLFRAREEVFKKQLDVFNQKGVKLTEKERQAIIQANHGDNIYDRLYSNDPERFPIPGAIISVLEGKETSIYDLQPVKRFVKKPEKVVLPSSAGSSVERLKDAQEKQPNPYAKQYFNGIRRSNRKVMPLFDLNEENEVPRKVRKDSEMTEEGEMEETKVTDDFVEVTVKIEDEEDSDRQVDEHLLRDEEKVLNDLKDAVSSQLDGEVETSVESIQDDENEAVDGKTDGKASRRLRNRDPVENGKIRTECSANRKLKTAERNNRHPEKLLKSNPETATIRIPKIFPRTCLAGYRIPKKKSESSDSENTKDTRGNSPLSPLSDIAATKCTADLYNQKRLTPSQPFLPQQQLLPQSPTSVGGTPWTNSGESHSPRLVIKLRKDPDSPRWRSDAYNNDISSDVSFRVIQNDWDPRNSKQEAMSSDSFGSNGSRYRFRNLGAKPAPKPEVAS